MKTSYPVLLQSFVGVVYCQYANDNKLDSHFIKGLMCKNGQTLYEEFVVVVFYRSSILFCYVLFFKVCFISLFEQHFLQTSCLIKEVFISRFLYGKSHQGTFDPIFLQWFFELLFCLEDCLELFSCLLNPISCYLDWKQVHHISNVMTRIHFYNFTDTNPYQLLLTWNHFFMANMHKLATYELIV